MREMCFLGVIGVAIVACVSVYVLEIETDKNKAELMTPMEYGESVRVIRGFYAGMVGVVRRKKVSKFGVDTIDEPYTCYLVEGDMGSRWISSRYLEKVDSRRGRYGN